jgi:hypothetical protein
MDWRWLAIGSRRWSRERGSAVTSDPRRRRRGRRSGTGVRDRTLTEDERNESETGSQGERVETDEKGMAMADDIHLWG